MHVGFLVLLLFGLIAAPVAASAQDVGRSELRVPPAYPSQVGTPSSWHAKDASNGPVKLRPELSSQLGHFHVGPLLGTTGSLQSFEAGKRDRPADPESPGDLRGVVGYQYPISEDGREAVGVNIQVAPDNSDAYDRLLLQPGVEYQAPLSSSWQFNARLYSTYAKDGATSLFSTTDRKVGLGTSSEGGTSLNGFRDVGIGLGVGYNVTRNWAIHTQAGVARQFGETKGSASTDKDADLNQYFGGVVVNYQF